MLKKRIMVLMIMITVATVFMGIGYAAVNSITLDISATASIKKNDTIKITNVEYVSDVLADTTTSMINNYNNTVISSKVVLGNDINSSITYEVTLNNSTDYDFVYLDTIHDADLEFYDNSNIVYTVTDINPGDRIPSEAEKKIKITFSYVGENIENNTLNSYINIKFNKMFSIEYVNIDDNNYPIEIEENTTSTINFNGDVDEIIIDGSADYTYEMGILTLSNVTSDLKITGIAGTPLYTTNKPGNLGSTVDPNNYSNSDTELSSTYLKYTIDSNNKVVRIESCKKETMNAPSICLTAVDKNKYDSNKDLLATYFGGTSSNLPDECSEEDNYGTLEFTCSNSYVVLAVDNDGGIFINDIENKKSCVINPTFGISSCH